MTRYALRRAVAIVPTLAILSFFVFILVRLIPGDPIGELLGKTQNPEVAAELRRFYGLDQPVLVQYLVWLQGLAHAELGRSIIHSVPVAQLVAERFPRTLWLMAGGIAVALLLALPTALIASARRNRWPDLLLSGFVTLLFSIPPFWLGILFILEFSVALHWLPATGYVEPWQNPLQFVSHLLLPWLTLGSQLAALSARVLRSSLLEVLQQDYVRTAAAKGVSERMILLRHALRNAAIPTMTLVGLEMGYLMGGAVVTERVFAYPGMGQFLLDAVTQRDYPVIQAGVLVFATAFIVMNLLTDLAVWRINPRTRLG